MDWNVYQNNSLLALIIYDRLTSRLHLGLVALRIRS